MSSHNDDDIVELDDLEFVEIDDPDIEALGDEPTGPDDLMFDEFEPTINRAERPSMADLAPRESATHPDATADRGPDATAPRQSGALPSVEGGDPRPSGAHQPVRQSGAHGAVRRSGPQQAIRESGALPAAQQPIRPSGAHKAVGQSGQFQAASQSGQFQAASQSGQFQAASQSGQFQAASQSGQFQAASQSGQFQAASQSGQFQAARESGQVPALGNNAPEATQRPPSGQFGAAPNLSAQQNFYNMPTGHTGRLQSVAGPEEIKTPGGLFRRGLLVCLPIAVIAMAVVGYFCVTRWLTPGQAMLWAGLGVTFPTIFAALIAAWPPEGQKASAKHWIAGLSPGLVFGLAGLVASLAWSQAEVRQQAFQYVPDEPQLLTKIFQENDLGLSVASCKRMVKQLEKPAWRVAVLRNMTLRPAAAAQCLKTLPEGAERDKVLSTVSSRWQQELLASTDGSENERMCQIAASMTELSLDKRVINAQLLTCTLTAADEGAQDCCGRVLAQNLSSHDEIIEQLRGSLNYVAGREAAGSLMSMAFHQHNLTKPQNTLASKLKFNSIEGQRATLELACVTLEEQNEASIVPHLAASLSDSCPVDHTALSQDPEKWIPVCNGAVAALEQDAMLEPPKALCNAAEGQFLAVAVGKASAFVHHAVRSNQRSGLGKSIDIGFVEERNQEMSPDEWARRAELQRQFLQDGMSPEKAAKRAGIDLGSMANMRPTYQGAPRASEDSVANILSTLGGGEAGKGKEGIGDFRKAAEKVTTKIGSGENPITPPPSSNGPPPQ